MRSIFLTLLVCTLINLPMQAQESNSINANSPSYIHAKLVDEIVSKEIEKQQLVGVAVGIISDSKVVYTNGYGFADRENGTPVNSKTLFRWASISKPVTAVTAMQLVESGKLDLGADVRKYVPEFPDHGHKIRVRDLMCHQSGIVHYTNGKVVRTKRNYQSTNPFKDVINALDTFRESPLIHAPGEQYSYSTHAYILLSAVVQRAGQQEFAEQVKERICKPLNLETLQPDYQWKEIPNRAIGYRRYYSAKKVNPSTDTDVSWKLGGGGFISSIEDLAGFAVGLMDEKLLSSKSKTTMFTRQALNDGTNTALGLGFFVSGNSISHNGAQEKTRTRMIFYPKSGFGIVVMTNTEHGQPGQITTAIIQALQSSNTERGRRVP